MEESEFSPVTRAILDRDAERLERGLRSSEVPVNHIKQMFTTQKSTGMGRESALVSTHWDYLLNHPAHYETPLQTASRIGWLPGVQLLIDHGVLVRGTHMPEDPPCALLWACRLGHAEVARMLLEHGTNVNCQHTGTKPIEPQSPLTIALEYLHVDVIKVLLNYGAILRPQINDKTYFDSGSFQRIIRTGKVHLVRLLIASGAGFDTDSLSCAIVHNMYIPYNAPEPEREELLTLVTQAGIKFNNSKMLSMLRDCQKHLYQPVHVPDSLDKLITGKLYTLSLQDVCRITVRQRLMSRANGRSILPAIVQLPLPWKLKDFLAFYCLTE